MLKKLRNKMLLMNMISTFCLITVAFSAIFAISYKNLEKDIEESLFRTFSFHRPMHFNSKPEEKRNDDVNGEKQPERVLSDMRNFSVFVRSDGTVYTNSMLGENSERYEKVANTALSQNSTGGEFKSEGIVWRFETRQLENGSKIIALADITAEKGFLRNLIVSFAVSETVLLIIMFFISLYFANKSITPVSEAWNKQKQFVADASHELRTPLAAINTNVDVLLSQGDKTIAEEEKWLRYIKSEASRLTELTGSLLFMAKIDNEAKVEMEAASVSDIVESAVLNLEAVAFENELQLCYDIEKDINAVCNNAQLTRLCVILIDNAIKYSHKGEKVTVTLKKASRDNLQLCVHNFGEPIGESDLPRIFDRFYREDKSRNSAGYGLGLSMAKDIVKVHRGKISVKSTKESGTEFTVTIPLK